MAVYRVKIDLGHANMGFSETYWTPDLDPIKVPARVQKMLQNRAALLAPDCFFLGVRLSLDGVRRSSSYIKPPSGYFAPALTRVQVPSFGTGLFDGQPFQESQLRQVLQLSTGFASGRLTTRYLSCIPQGLTRTEPATYFDNLGGWWSGAFDTFQNEILSGWQVRAQVVTPNPVPTKPQPVAFQVIGIGTAAGVNADTLLAVRVKNGASAPAWTTGQRIKAQGFRPPKGTRNPTLNGTWYVDSVITGSTTSQVLLRGSGSITPAMVNFTDNTFLVQTQFDYFPITIYTPKGVGVHKRGKQAGSPRGRRLTHVSLDP